MRSKGKRQARFLRGSIPPNIQLTGQIRERLRGSNPPESDDSSHRPRLSQPTPSAQELRKRQKAEKTAKIKARREQKLREAFKQKTNGEIANLLKNRLWERLGHAVSAEVFIETAARLDEALASLTTGFLKKTSTAELADMLQEKMTGSGSDNAEDKTLIAEVVKRLRASRSRN